MVIVIPIYALLGILNLCFAGSIQDVPEQVSAENMVAPMVVEFYRPSCSHCQSMAPIFSRVAKECANGTHFYRVNADDMGRANGLAQSITHNQLSNLSGVPTFVFVNKNGNNKCEIKVGGMKKQELQNKVAQLQ